MLKRILFLLLVPALSFAKSNGHDLKIKIVGLHDTVAYLGNHFGDKQFIIDTSRVNHEGWAEFSGKDTLPGGIYLVITPRKTYFEILVTATDQNYSIETDTTDFVNKFVVKGSPENKLFAEYQQYLSGRIKESGELRTKLASAKTEKDSSAIMERNKILDKEIKDFRLKLMSDNPNSFVTKILTTIREPEIPEAPKDANGKVIDSLFAYHYFKAHFWDNVDFSDERLLRTPILQSKIKQYLSQLTSPAPDSIIQSVFLIIEKSRANKEVFRYCVASLAPEYENSKIMGYDKIFVAIAEKYYLSNEAYWADSTMKAKIEDRVNKIKPNLLGTPAHNLIMPDTSFVMHSLYDVKADYTVLVFWDPTCGHCKKEIPALSHYYDSVKATKLSIEVFAVGIESDMNEWKNFIKDNKLKWINVSDLYNTTHFRDFYDIYSTPVIYLLDDKKNLIAKRLDTEKIKGFIDDRRKAQKH